MAHTNSTPNYNLPQFLGTDKPAWLTDINTAMSDIDAAIAAAKSTADSADAAVSALGITVGNHTTQLSTLSGAVTSQGNTLNTVTALIGNGTPTTTDQTIIGAINEINADQGDLNDLTTTDKSSVVAAINEVKGNVTGLIIKEDITATFTSGKSNRVTSLADKMLISAELLGNALIAFADVDGGLKVGYSFASLDGSMNVDTSVNGSKTIHVTYTL